MSALAKLIPAPGATVSPGPWRITDDGTVIAADDKVVCVLGHPDEALTEQDVVNGMAILAIGGCRPTAREARRISSNWDKALIETWVDRKARRAVELTNHNQNTGASS